MSVQPSLSMLTYPDPGALPVPGGSHSRGSENSDVPFWRDSDAAAAALAACRKLSGQNGAVLSAYRVDAGDGAAKLRRIPSEPAGRGRDFDSLTRSLNAVAARLRHALDQACRHMETRSRGDSEAALRDDIREFQQCFECQTGSAGHATKAAYARELARLRQGY
jgi:hypothetical protein